jgi:hypothetical protein
MRALGGSVHATLTIRIRTPYCLYPSRCAMQQLTTPVGLKHAGSCRDGVGRRDWGSNSSFKEGYGPWHTQ